jgi:ribonuclease E
MAAPVAAAASETLAGETPALMGESAQASRTDAERGDRGERGGRRSRRGGRRRRGRGEGGGGEGAGQAGAAAVGAAGDGGYDDSGSDEAPRDLADFGAASDASEREPMPSPVLGAPRTFEASPGDSSRPAQSVAEPPAREPASRSFDFDRPAAPPVSPQVDDAAEPRDVGAQGAASRDAGAPAPVAAPAREREPATVATAVEPREWTPTPPTDTPTSRSEP